MKNCSKGGEKRTSDITQLTSLACKEVEEKGGDEEMQIAFLQYLAMDIFSFNSSTIRIRFPTQEQITEAFDFWMTAQTYLTFLLMLDDEIELPEV